MKYKFITVNKEIIKINLFDADDSITVTEPDNIIAFQSEHSYLREDYIFDEIKITYKRKTKIKGPSTTFIKSSSQSSIRILKINQDNQFIFNLNILFYTKDIKVNISLEDMKHIPFKNNMFRYECCGIGEVGYYAEGDLIEIDLEENETIFINPNNVLGYTKDISYEMRTYGNDTAALKMDYHYKFIGKGKILIQTQSMDSDITQVINNKSDNFIKRTLKEFIPFLNIVWK